MNISNTRNLRKINQEKIINALINRDACTKNELSTLTGLSLGSVNNIVADLLKSHQVIESGYAKSTGGRPSKHYELNSNYSKNLCLSIFKNSNRIHLVYRVYNLKDELLMENRIVRPKISIEDIYEILDSVLEKIENIKVIGVSIPGIIKDEKVISTGIDNFKEISIIQLLKEKYEQKIIFGNDVNTAAIGFYLDQENYEDICLLFQPANHCAGVGIIVNGRMLKGMNNLAGEVQYLPIDLTDNMEILLNSKKGHEELITRYTQSIIAMLNPQAIGICSTIVDDYSNIKENLNNIFEKEELPELIKIHDLIEYIMWGINLLCKDSLKSNLTITKKTIM